MRPVTLTRSAPKRHRSPIRAPFTRIVGTSGSRRTSPKPGPGRELLPDPVEVLACAGVDGLLAATVRGPTSPMRVRDEPAALAVAASTRAPAPAARPSDRPLSMPVSLTDLVRMRPHVERGSPAGRDRHSPASHRRPLTRARSDRRRASAWGCPRASPTTVERRRVGAVLAAETFPRKRFCGGRQAVGANRGGRHPAVRSAQPSSDGCTRRPCATVRCTSSGPERQGTTKVASDRPWSYSHGSIRLIRSVRSGRSRDVHREGALTTARAAVGHGACGGPGRAHGGLCGRRDRASTSRCAARGRSTDVAAPGQQGCKDQR